MTLPGRAGTPKTMPRTRMDRKKQEPVYTVCRDETNVKLITTKIQRDSFEEY